ncbi:MAG: alkaline phosphatase family protein [Myxococcaceae bacterium]
MSKAWVAVLLLVSSSAAFAKPPKLTLFITVDALGSDLLYRARPRLKGGLSQLISNGAYFPVVRYGYAENVTSVGHTTLVTGANPWRHGVVSNRLVNRNSAKPESLLADPNHPVLEAPLNADDVSPENLLTETLSDRLRASTHGRGKAIAIAGKARSAIIMAGKLGRAWWFNETVGKFVTGTYYVKEFPAWVKGFNEKKPADAYFGKEWTLSQKVGEYTGEDDRPYESDWYSLGRVFPHPLSGGLPAAGPQSYSALAVSPMMNDVMVQFAKAAIEGEQLGKDEIPDLLSVGFSATDRIYHFYGPYSWEMQDAMVRLDQAVGDLVTSAEKAAGKGNVLVVLSADHGGAAIPEEWAAMGLPGARVHPNIFVQGLNKELQARFGAELVAGIEEIDVYLNNKVIADKRLDAPSVRRLAAQWLARQPQVAVAVAKDDLYGPNELTGYLRALRVGYYPERSGDVLLMLKPFNVLTDEPFGTNHGTAYSYDSQVPLVLFGKGVKPGQYRTEISSLDVAPTVAALLEMGAPASSEGQPRGEALGGGK